MSESELMHLFAMVDLALGSTHTQGLVHLFGLILAVLRHPSGSEAYSHHLKEILRHDPYNLTVLTLLALIQLFEYQEVKCVRLL